jgi:hypothetical protein
MAATWEILAVFYCAFAVISLFSYLFKRLPTFDIVEGVLVGGVAAQLVATSYPRLIDYSSMIGGRPTLIIPMILGLSLNLIVTRFRWIAYYPSAWPIGIGLGLAVSRGIDAQIWRQLRSKVVGNLITAQTGLDWFNAIIIAFATLTSLAYFLYSREQKGAFGTIARVGRLFMLVSLGLSWANYVTDKLDLNTALLDITLNTTRKVLGIG